jgi:folate-dependent phosphoribosylglycinamide formyltransferase PurN
VLPDDDAETLKARVQAVEHRLLPQVVKQLIS